MGDPQTASEPLPTLDILAVTEVAAIAAARERGRGDERLADRAAAAAMRDALGRLPVRGRIVVGPADDGEEPLLALGQEVGSGEGPDVDIALMPLEGRTICAKNLPNAIAAMAVARRGGLLSVPDIYMDKIAVGPFYADGVIDLATEPAEAVRRLARAKGVDPRQISACILDRPRHAALVAAVRGTGASIRLIGDGDVAGIIHATDPDATGIDIYLGSGGAPEGVLAAAALRCLGGQMVGRLICDTADKAEAARRAGIPDPRRSFGAADMASGEIIFAATGVTDGYLLPGVRFAGGAATTHSIVTRSSTGTQRWVRSRHRGPDRARLRLTHSGVTTRWTC